MRKIKKELTEFEKAVCSAWPDTAVENINISDCGGYVRITVSKMYEYLPLNLKHLIALANVFQTDRFTVNSHDFGGCETCDYGSSYEHEFAYKKSDVGIFDALEIRK